MHLRISLANVHAGRPYTRKVHSLESRQAFRSPHRHGWSPVEPAAHHTWHQLAHRPTKFSCVTRTEGLNLRLGYQNADVNFVDLILSVYISGEMFYHHWPLRRAPLAKLLVSLPNALPNGLTWSNVISGVWSRQDKGRHIQRTRIRKSMLLRGGRCNHDREGQPDVGGAAVQIYAADPRYAQKCKEFVLIRTDKGRSVV